MKEFFPFLILFISIILLVFILVIKQWNEKIEKYLLFITIFIFSILFGFIAATVLEEILEFYGYDDRKNFWFNFLIFTLIPSFFILLHL